MHHDGSAQDFFYFQQRILHGADSYLKISVTLQFFYPTVLSESQCNFLRSASISLFLHNHQSCLFHAATLDLSQAAIHFFCARSARNAVCSRWR